MTARRPRVRRRVAVLLGVLGFAACRVQEVPRAGRADPAEIAREEIDATRDVYRQALLGGNADALAGAFTRDGTIAEPDADDVVGTTAIETAMQRRFAHAPVTDLLLERESLDIAEGGVANELGRFEQTVQLTGRPPTTLRGRYMFRWLRVPDGDWRIHYALYNLYPADTSAIR